jgi:hypothetical protein
MSNGDDVDDRLREMYTDMESPAAYSSLTGLRAYAQRQGLNVSRERVARFLSDYSAYSIFLRKRERHKEAIFATSLNEVWMADLAFLNPKKTPMGGYIGFLLVY